MILGIAIIFINVLLFNCQFIPEGRCKTFTNEIGSCISVKSCSIFRKVLENVLSTQRNFTDREFDYFQRSSCGVGPENDQLVCCADRYNAITAIASKPTTGLFYFSDTTALNPIKNLSDRNNINLEQHPNSVLLPTFSNCGYKLDLNDDDRIAQGNATNLMEFPWMALLQYRTFDNELIFRCAGTLISKRYILTAAHCVKRNDLVSIRLGENFIKSETDCQEDSDGEIVCAPPIQDIEIEEVIIHPDFKEANDIALVRLKVEANINNDSVIPICLPITTQLQDADKKKLQLAGWGLTEKGTSFEKMFKAHMSVKPINTCENAYRRSFTKNQICVYGKNGVDTCKGDSGGPGMYQIRLGLLIRTVQYGIISGGNNQCNNQDSFPGILTNVPSFILWILDNIRA